MDLTLEKVTPFLPTLKPSQTTRVEAWLPVVGQLLSARYGDAITTDNEPVFVSAAADAIQRRLERPGFVLQQSVATAAVKYDPRAALLRWFLPEQLDELDGFLGRGSVRSVRMSAPDGIRFGNRARELDQYAESDGFYSEGD